MKVLVACEESQRVCSAFRALGHEAYSCDIIDCSGGHYEWHIKQDVLPLLNGNCKFTTADGAEHTISSKWDLIIAHPPCTYLSNAGACRLYPKKGQLDQERYKKGLQAKIRETRIRRAFHGRAARQRLGAKHLRAQLPLWLNNGLNMLRRYHNVQTRKVPAMRTRIYTREGY